MNEVPVHVVWITPLRVQEHVELHPSIRLAMAAAQLRKECERCAALIIKAAVTKVLAKQK